MNKVFKNLKVVEIASVLAGPSVGMFFSELGAEVIKVENEKTKGDVTRSWKLPSEPKDVNLSAYFCAVNYKKKYLFLDLTHHNDIVKVKQLISECDIVILNFKKGDDIKFGLDYNTLKQINKKLIYASINGFGEHSDRVAYDLILQAETGFMSMNGTPDSGPVKMPVALIDILAGHQLKEGILVALLEREKTGQGQKISVSLYDSAIASLANQATNWLMGRHIAKPIGSKHPNIAPYGELFKTKDNKLITFAIGSNKQFINLCNILNLSTLSNDSRFNDNRNRVKNRVELEDILSQEIIKYVAEELISKLHQSFVPVAKINNIDEVFKNKDAQRLILTENIQGVDTKCVKTVVFK
ncbi:MAG TPA: CoA transferase [Crocinitomix sp.]|nr:CoA transferase [Crocinitomix sp.]